MKKLAVILFAARPSTALVVACLALGIALGGTGYAAINLPARSVGTAQLKKNAVISSKVKDRSLLARDFKQGQLPAGSRGLQGEKGDKGDKGDTGNPGANGTAVAYAHILPTGAIDTANSTGVVSVTRPLPGFYCLQLNFRPKNAVATVVTYDGAATYTGFVGIDIRPGLSGTGCHGSVTDDTLVRIFRQDGSTLMNAPFYVLFQ